MIEHRLERRLASVFCLLAFSFSPFVAAGAEPTGHSRARAIVGGDPSADIRNMRKLRFVVRAGVVKSVEELRADVAAEQWRAAGR